MKTFNYTYYDNLMSNFRFKTLYKEKANKVFEKKGTENGTWRLCKKNNQYGILNELGVWLFLNTINTHPYCFLELHKFYFEQTGVELNFNDELNWKKNIEILWDFIEDNYDLLFTQKINTTYYYIFMFRCNSSWSKGIITTISFLLNLRSLFPELKIKKIEYDFERGNTDDFKGIDVKIILKDGSEITFQIKSGKIVAFDGDNYVIESSINDHKTSATYYCFVNINEYTKLTDIVIFKNDKSSISKIDDQHLFHKDTYMNKKIQTYMGMDETLMEIFSFCSKNKIVFNLLTEGENNNITYENLPEKIVNITIVDFKDDKLPELLLTEQKSITEYFS